MRLGNPSLKPTTGRSQKELLLAIQALAKITKTEDTLPMYLFILYSCTTPTIRWLILDNQNRPITCNVVSNIELKRHFQVL